jgi:hypothetical protein
MKELADEVADLRVYGRCCNASPCGRFYCVPREERRELHRRGLTRNVGLELTVAKGKIVEVETCSPDVDAALQLVFPDPEYDNDAP